MVPLYIESDGAWPTPNSLGSWKDPGFRDAGPWLYAYMTSALSACYKGFSLFILNFCTNVIADR